jgi:hypothetical protein
VARGTGSLTMTVDGGRGAALAFRGGQVLLPIASNALGAKPGDLRAGQWIEVEVRTCPNASNTSMSMVAARITVPAPPARPKHR